MGVTPGRTKSIEAKGLFTAPNPIAVSQEAFLQLDNMVLDAPGLPRSRRGTNVFTTSGQGNAIYTRMWGYQGGIVAFDLANAKLWGVSSAGVMSLIASSINIVNDFTTPFAAQMNGNLYITTGAGVYALEALAGTYRKCGVAKGVGFDPINSYPTVNGDAAGTPTVIADGQQFAYRYTLVQRDANQNVIEGSPSGRYIASNTSGSAHTPKMRAILPAEATTANWLRCYRSNSCNNGYNAANTPAVTPSEDLQLVFESPQFSSTDISNKYYDITDITPDQLRGAFIITSPSAGDGPAQAPDPPPNGNDICAYKNRLWLALTTPRQRLYVTLIAVQTGGSGPGLVSGDTITIGGVTYTAGAAQNVGTNTFLLVNGSSAAINIEQTSRNLVALINESASNTTLYAFYASGPNDLPGKVLLESRWVGSGFSAFTAASSRGTVWTPNLAAAQSSTAQQLGNQLCYSKINQPEAWPASNYFFVGTSDTNIIRLAPLKDGVLIFKDGNGGLWKLTGDDVYNFRIVQLDPSVQLVSPNSIAFMDQLCYGLAKKGVFQANMSGVQTISDPIFEDIILEITDASPAGIYGPLISFGVADEKNRRYWLFYPANPSLAACFNAKIYNARTQTWTTASFQNAGFASGLLNPADRKFYLAEWVVVLNTAGYIYVERNAYTRSDFRDTNKAATDFALINTVQWTPFYGDEPLHMKHWRELLFEFGSNLTGLSIACSTEDSAAQAFTPTLTPGSGSPSITVMKVRDGVPLETSRARRLSVTLTHAVLQEDFVLNGFELVWNEYGRRSAR